MISPSKILWLLAVATLAGAHEPVVGLPCENCEVVFEGMPAQPRTSARIAPAGIPGYPGC